MIAATPATVASAASVELRFTGELAMSRGGYYVLVDDSGAEIMVMNTDANSQVPPISFLPTDTLVPVLDYALSGPGPERIVLPTLPSGQYQLCTYNSEPRGCVQLTVTG